MSPTNRDDVERLVRVETKLDDVMRDMSEIAILLRDKVSTHDESITELKTKVGQHSKLIGLIGSAIALAWLAALIK